MQVNGPLFEEPLPIVSDRGDHVLISMLDKRGAIMHAAELVPVHNLIPFVYWTSNELIADQHGGRVFHHKWDLSILLSNSLGEPIGFLVSYLRPPDSNFDRVSIYMHRMAILRPLQRRGIGKRVISAYLNRVFKKLTVDYVTLQANDTSENAGIVGLYETLGFSKAKLVFYPDKTDWLMVRPRLIGPESSNLNSK